MKEVDNLQLLGAALIVLSLALLYCWYKKTGGLTVTYGRDGMRGGYADPTRSPFEGLRSSPAPDLKFANSMHEREGTTVNRNPPTDEQKRSNVTGLRWEVEGMTPVDQSDMFSLDNYEAARIMAHQDPTNRTWSAEVVDGFYDNMGGNYPVSGDVITPFKPFTSSNCTTHSGDQLSMTESGMNYGRRATVWSEPTNTARFVTM